MDELETKTGARNNANDRARIRNIRKAASEIVAHTMEIEPTDSDEMPMMEPDWQPVKNDTLVAFGDTVKAIGENRIEGYLVRFGNPDEPDLSPMADFFTRETYYGARNGEGVDATLNHGIPLKTRAPLELDWTKPIGRIESVKADDYGLLAQAIIEADEDYKRVVMQMVKQGRLKWSSGAVAHLVKRTEMANGTNRIDQWIIGEGALTPTPAEPRLPAIMPIKAYTAIENNFELDTEAAQEANATTDADAAGVKTENQTENSANKAQEIYTEMDENQIVALTEKLEAQQKAIDELKAAQAKPQNEGGLVVPQIKKVTERGFANDEMKSFIHMIRTGDMTAYKAAMQGQTDSEGGYAVPDDFYNQVVAKRNEASVMRAAGAQVMQTSLDRVLVPVEDTAATKFVVTAEEGAYSENEPTLNQVAITVHKLTKLIKISEELEADAKANFAGYLAGVWGRTLALAENYYFFNIAANGSSQPQSVTYAATTTTAVASQTAFTAAELLTLIYTMPSAYSGRMALAMRRTTLGAIRSLTGNPFAFMPTPEAGGVSGNTVTGAAGTIHGIPVFLTDDLPAQAAANKPVVLFNPDFYMVVEREGLMVSRNPWLYQANGQIGWFAKAREGGALLQAEAAYVLVSKT